MTPGEHRPGGAERGTGPGDVRTTRDGLGRSRSRPGTAPAAVHAGAALAALTAVPVLFQCLDHAVATASAISGDFYSTLDRHTVHPGVLGGHGQLTVLGLVAVAAVVLPWAAYRMWSGSRAWWWAVLVLLAVPAGQQVVDRTLLGGRWHPWSALPLPLLTAALLLTPAARRFVRGGAGPTVSSPPRG